MAGLSLVPPRPRPVNWLTRRADQGPAHEASSFLSAGYRGVVGLTRCVMPACAAFRNLVLFFSVNFVKMVNPKVFFDITIGGAPAGRIVMEVRTQAAHLLSAAWLVLPCVSESTMQVIACLRPESPGHPSLMCHTALVGPASLFCGASFECQVLPRRGLPLQLYADVVPRTAENFRALCTGKTSAVRHGAWPESPAASCFFLALPCSHAVSCVQSSKS